MLWFRNRIAACYACALAISAALLACGHASADAPTVFARYKGRTAHIETIGDLFNGTRRIGSGSGLLITARHVVTNNHVVPPAAWYKSLTINVRLGSRDSIPVHPFKIHRDVDRDLAIIELAEPLTVGCPVSIVVEPPETVPEGTELFGLGFPVDEELSISNPGSLSNKKAPFGRWTTSILFNVGNSGEPVFTSTGRLAGFACWRRVTSYQSDGGERQIVVGINRFIPFSQLASSPLYEILTSTPASERCWGETTIAALPTTSSPSVFRQSFNVDFTNDDAPPISRRDGRTLFRNGTFTDISGKSEIELAVGWAANKFSDYQIKYPKLFEFKVGATSGYRFDDREPPKFVLASLNPTNTPLPNHPCTSSSDLDCWDFRENRREVSFRLRLYAGWEADRTRGWIHGEVLLLQALDH